MLAPFLLLITLVLELSAPSFGVSATPSNPLNVDCQSYLRDEIVRGTVDSFQPWSELPRELATFQEATLLVRLNPEKNLYSLETLMNLVGQLDVKTFPEAYHFGTWGLFALVHGTSQSLNRAQAFLADKIDAGDLSFRLLIGRSSISQDLSSDIENRLVTFRSADPDSTDQANTQIENYITAEKSAFVIWDLSYGVMVYAFPRTQLELSPIWVTESPNLEKIRTPINTHIANWISRKQFELKNPIFAVWGDYLLLSESAFKRLAEKNGFQAQGPVESATDLEENLVAELQRCLYEGLCTNTSEEAQVPEVPESVELSAEDRLRVVEFLRQNARPDFDGNLSAKFALNRLFTSAMKNVVPESQSPALLAKLNSISFKATDGTAIYHSASAQGRFVQAWRLLVDYFAPERSQDPLSAKTLGLIQQKLGTSENALNITPSTENVSVNKARKMLGILRENLPPGEVTKNGLKTAFQQYISRYGDRKAQAEARRLLNKIDFSVSDYRLITRENFSQPAVNRFESAWRILAALLNVPLSPEIKSEEIHEVEKILQQSS